MLHFLNHVSKAVRENGARALAKRETKYDLLEKEFPTTFDAYFSRMWKDFTNYFPYARVKRYTVSEYKQEYFFECVNINTIIVSFV